MRAQILWAEHAAFMNALAAEGFVVLGGPLGEGAEVLLIVDAPSEDAIRARLAADPWMVDVHQIVHDLSGKVVKDQSVRHAYVIEDGLIRRMEIRSATP